MPKNFFFWGGGFGHDRLGAFGNYRGAEKFLARPGRKQATATLTLTFASHSKKKSEVCPFNQVSAAAMTSASDEKWRPFNCLFSRIGLRTYQHPCSWTHPTYNNFIIFKLISKHLLAQHIPPSFYTSHPSHWELPYGSTEPFFSGVPISPTDSRLSRFLAAVCSPVRSWTECRMQVLYLRKLQITDDENLTV